MTYAIAGRPLPPPHGELTVELVPTSVPMSIPVDGSGLITMPWPHAFGLSVNSMPSYADAQPGSFGKSVVPLPSLSLPSPHCGQPAPSGHGSDSSSACGTGQPGSFG